MRTRFMATTALVLSLALPAAAGAAQTTAAQTTAAQTGTKIEQSTSVSASTRLLNDAEAQLRSAMMALDDIKDAAAGTYAEARESARIAIRKAAAALDGAKAEVAETSRDAWTAARARIDEARALIDDEQSKPEEISASLGSVGDAVGDVKLGAAAGASGSAGARTAATVTTDGRVEPDSKAGIDAKAEAKSSGGVLGSVGSTVGSTVGTGTDAAAGATGAAWNKVELVGKSVQGADREEVGEIDDVVMAEGGKVESVLVDVGGFLGIGAKRIAIPVANLEVQGDTVVATGLTRKQAEAMPEYKRQQ